MVLEICATCPVYRSEIERLQTSMPDQHRLETLRLLDQSMLTSVAINQQLAAPGETKHKMAS